MEPAKQIRPKLSTFRTAVLHTLARVARYSRTKSACTARVPHGFMTPRAVRAVVTGVGVAIAVAAVSSGGRACLPAGRRRGPRGGGFIRLTVGLEPLGPAVRDAFDVSRKLLADSRGNFIGTGIDDHQPPRDTSNIARSRLPQKGV